MTKHVEKPIPQPLVHHPSSVLDVFCHCDASDRKWLEFDEGLSHQLIELEFNNRQHIRARPQFDRRSLGA